MCSSFLRWNQFKFWPLSSSIFQRGKRPSCVPEIPVLPTAGVWKVEGLDTPSTIYTPGSFTLKPAGKNRERLLPNSIFINCRKCKKCLSTGLGDKIAPSHLPIIFRLLKIIWKISPRAGSGLSQHSLASPYPCWAVSISVLALHLLTVYLYGLPAVNFSLALCGLAQWPPHCEGIPVFFI